jgi:hypothetical protein
LEEPVWDRVTRRLLGTRSWSGRGGARVGEGLRTGGGEGGRGGVREGDGGAVVGRDVGGRGRRCRGWVGRSSV